MDELSDRDEGRHPPGDELLWAEMYSFDFADRSGALGGVVRVCLYPNRGSAWVWVAVVGQDRRLVTVDEPDVAVPRDQSLELRGPGLWLDVEQEVAFDHFTVGLEAFALGIDEPSEGFGEMRGDLLPLGLDLEWETDAPPFVPAGIAGRHGYEIPCRVHGEVIVGHEQIEVDAFGQRDHSWGVIDWWRGPTIRFAGRLDDGEWLLAVRDGATAVGYRGSPRRTLRGTGKVGLRTGRVEGRSPGVPPPVELTLEGERLGVEEVAWAPAVVGDPQGRPAHVVRSLVRLDAPGGRRGVGWVELSGPA